MYAGDRAVDAFLVRADSNAVECALSQGFERAVGAFLVQTDKNPAECAPGRGFERAFGAFLVRADIIPVECALSQGFERAFGAFLVQTDKNPAECMRVSAHSAGFVARTSCSNVAAAYATSTLPWRPTRSVISARRTMLRASIRQGSSMRMTSPDAASTRSSTWSRPG